MSRAFISYRSPDRNRIVSFIDTLRQCGISIFWDQEISPGNDWYRRIMDEIEHSDALVAFWSKNCVSERGEFLPNNEGLYYMRIEHLYAHRKGIPILPITLDPNCVPGEFSHLQYSSLDGSTSPNALVGRLVKQIDSAASTRATAAGDLQDGGLSNFQFDVLIYADSAHPDQDCNSDGIRRYIEVTAGLFDESQATYCPLDEDAIARQVQTNRSQRRDCRQLICCHLGLRWVADGGYFRVQSRCDEIPALQKIHQILNPGDKIALVVGPLRSKENISEYSPSVIANLGNVYRSAGAVRDELLPNRQIFDPRPRSGSTRRKPGKPRLVLFWGDEDRLSIGSSFAADLAGCGIRATVIRWDKFMRRLFIHDQDSPDRSEVSDSSHPDALAILKSECDNADVIVYYYFNREPGGGHIGAPKFEMQGYDAQCLFWLDDECGLEFKHASGVDPRRWIGNQGHLLQLLRRRASQ